MHTENPSKEEKSRGMRIPWNKVNTVILIMLIAVACLPITEYWTISTPSPQFVWNGTPFRPVGVNYYPRTHPWTGTWEQFNATELAEDCRLIKSLGGNCLRTFIQWRLVEPVPWVYNMTIVSRVVEFFQVVSAENLSIMLSFFDFGPPEWAHVNQDAQYYNATLIAHQKAQLEFMIPLLNQSKAAFIWDLRNEPSSQTVPMEDFVLWVENLTTTIRALGDSHYIVVGGGYGNFEDPSDYAHLVDAVCMHWYGAGREPQRRRAFEVYLQKFTDCAKPIIVQEFGWSSSGNVTEEMVAEYYRTMFNLFDKHGIAGIMPWCLWDYGPNFWSESEANFGLMHYDGTLKRAGLVFQQYTQGTLESASNYWGWEGLY